MDLGAAATYFCTTPLEVYDATLDSWVAGTLTGNIVPTDRFLTIYNRPVHLRQLTFPSGSTLPASKTIRNQQTGEVYLIGQPRYDTRGSAVYVGTAMLHLVSGYAGGLTTVHRKGTVGPSNNPGVLVDAEVAKAYFDAEIRSSSEKDGQIASSRGEYLLWTTTAIALQPWDFILLAGSWYRVHQVYFDSGLQMARVFKEPDRREDLTYYRKTSGYNADTGASGSYTAYSISGLVESYNIEGADRSDMAPNEVDLRVLEGHIGFAPSVYDEFSTAAGVRYSVTKVGQVGTMDEWVIRGQS